MQTHRVPTFELERPGDWFPLKELPSGTSLEREVIWLRLPCGHDGQITDHEVTIEDDRLTVHPSIVCPVEPEHPGGHGWLRGGEWRPA